MGWPPAFTTSHPPCCGQSPGWSFGWAWASGDVGGGVSERPSGCDVLGRQAELAPCEAEGRAPGLPEPGVGGPGGSLTEPPGKMPLSAGPAKVTSALINLINKTVHQGGHYLLIEDDRVGRSCPAAAPRPRGPSAPEGGAGGGAGAAPASGSRLSGGSLPKVRGPPRCKQPVVRTPPCPASRRVCSGPAEPAAWPHLLGARTRRRRRRPRAGTTGSRKPASARVARRGVCAALCAGGLSSLDRGLCPRELACSEIFSKWQWLRWPGRLTVGTRVGMRVWGWVCLPGTPAVL